MVSIVLTVYNEHANVNQLLEDILSSSMLADEVVITDGGSTDDTVEIINSYIPQFSLKGISLKVITEHGANIAQGRNIAIKNARNEIIAVTDAGCRIDKEWLDRLTRPLREKKADFVAGFFKAIAFNSFQYILAEVTVSTEPPKNFLPSSRSVAFNKQTWKKVGGYPEWLKWGEDTFFNKSCISSGAVYEVVPDAIVYWEVRKTFSQAMKQYYHYAFGDGLMLRCSGSIIMLQITYWFCILLLLLGLSGAALFCFLTFHGAIYIRRRGFVLNNFSTSLVVLLGIQSSRFCGYCIGFLTSFLSR
jgi:glycosyltransferase involved in cell wall biosynthesis